MSLCLSDLRKVDKEGVWPYVEEGMMPGRGRPCAVVWAAENVCSYNPLRRLHVNAGGVLKVSSGPWEESRRARLVTQSV